MIPSIPPPTYDEMIEYESSLRANSSEQHVSTSEIAIPENTGYVMVSNTPERILVHTCTSADIVTSKLRSRALSKMSSVSAEVLRFCEEHCSTGMETGIVDFQDIFVENFVRSHIEIVLCRPY